MTDNGYEGFPAPTLPELEQALIRERIDYLSKNTDFSLTLFRTLVAYAVIAADFDGNVVAFNEGARRAFGYAPDEVIGRHSIELFFPQAFVQGGNLEQAIAAVTHDGQCTYEGEMLRKGGEHFPVHAVLNLTKDAEGRTVGLILIAEDITERKLAQERILALNAELERRVLERTAALAEKEEQLRTAMETARDAIVMVEAERATITAWNPAAETIFGYSKDEVIGRGILDFLPAARDREAALKGMTHFTRTGEITEINKTLELAALHKNGTEFPIELSLSAMRLGSKLYVTGIARDISARKQAEEELMRLNWALRALGQSNSALVHAETEKELFQVCCDAIAGTGAYALAWIGLARDDPARSIEISAAAGEEIKYLEGLELSWGDVPQGSGPTAMAIRTGATQVTSNLAEGEACLPWIERARAHGFASSISLPIRANSVAMGTLTICSREADAFGPREIDLFEELAADIGYGIASRRTRTERDQLQQEQLLGIKRLKTALIGTIGAVGLTVEKRDPYTAGHQLRVAELCVAIGRKLGLTEDTLEGLRLGATIHDIGKIYVPSEILSRPGKLTRPEFEIIKSHPQVGYDIVKDVTFPWPVKDMILQHHERLDGAGYPQGLKGDEIILEARILAVADVIEAMSSHRPYRPGLGLDAALAQIRREAGTGLDLQVVEACERLFREDGFAFEKT